LNTGSLSVEVRSLSRGLYFPSRLVGEIVAVNYYLLMLNLYEGDLRSNKSEEDDDDFYDAISEQTEEIKIALPSDKKVHQSVHFIITCNCLYIIVFHLVVYLKIR